MSASATLQIADLYFCWPTPWPADALEADPVSYPVCSSKAWLGGDTRASSRAGDRSMELIKREEVVVFCIFLLLIPSVRSVGLSVGDLSGNRSCNRSPLSLISCEGAAGKDTQQKNTKLRKTHLPARLLLYFHAERRISGNRVNSLQLGFCLARTGTLRHQ